MKEIRRIVIEGFRAVLDPLTLDFSNDCRSMAVFGENAAGKSSLADAVEWFYYGRVDHLWKENCHEESLRNTLLAKAASSTVRMTFNEGPLDSVKSLDPALSSSQSNKSKDLSSYLDEFQDGQERLVLRNADLLVFVLSTKTEKRQYLAEIIGYEALDSFREAIQRAQYQIETNTEYVTAKKNLPSHQKEVAMMAGETVTDDGQLFAVAQKLAANAGVMVKICDDDSYSLSVENLKTQIGQQAGATLKLKLGQAAESLRVLGKVAASAVDTFGSFIIDYEALLKSEEELRQIKLEGFLALGKKTVDEGLGDEGVCPLCEQPKSHEELREQLRVRLEKLRESRKKSDAALAKKGAAAADLGSASRAAESAIGMCAGSGSGQAVLDIVRGYKAFVDALLSRLTIAFNNYEPIESKLETETASLGIEIENEGLRLAGEIRALELSKEQQKLVDLISLLEKLRDTYLRWRRDSLSMQSFDAQIRTLATIKSRFSAVYLETLQSALDLMSGLISRYYIAMHPGENVDELQLRVLEEGVEFQYRFRGQLAYPPRKYLSESHLNSLGIAAFLAAANLFNKSTRFLVLDDVVTSFDANHRLRLLRLLTRQFSDWQLLLLTHEPVWFEMIKKEVAPKGWVISEIEMLPSGTVQLSGAPDGMKELVNQKIARGTAVASDLRVLLENILKEICSELQAKVEFRFNEINEKRMPGELLSALKATLNKRSPTTVGLSIFGRVDTDCMLLNVASHDSSPGISSGDFRVCHQDIFEFDGVFCCSACKSYVSVERYSDPDRKVFCKCRKLELAWKQ